jgi:hypothetical protein
MLTFRRKLILSLSFLATLALFVAVIALATPYAVQPVGAVAQSKTVQTLSTTPLTPTMQTITSTDGIVFPNNGETMLWFINGAATSVAMTITTPYEPISGFSLEDLNFTIGAGQTRAVGPLDVTYFNYSSGTNKGKVLVQASTLSTVTVAILSY